MDGKLWMTLYRQIRRACKSFASRVKVGRPQEYGVQDILAVFAFAALIDRPVYRARQTLCATPVRWWLRRYWSIPAKIPSDSTLSRRSQTTEFRRLLRRVLRQTRRTLGLPSGRHVVLDATLLLTGAYSGDAQSRWTCHGGKWYRGYALHVVCDRQGRLVAHHVTSANVQEMKAARRLVRQMAAQRHDVDLVIADGGYDSEPLHQLIRRRLEAQLLAPLNLRGGKKSSWRLRQPGRASAEKLLQTSEGQLWMKERSSVERWNSCFKSHSRVSMLPHHARGLRRVRLWVDLKLALFLVHQSLTWQDLHNAS